MANRSVLLVGLLVLTIPLRSETPKAVLVPGSDHTCPAQLPDGTKYEVHLRTLKAQWQQRVVYVLVKAYYKPSSGEFLFYSSIIRQQEQPPRNLRGSWWSCEPNDRTVALLEDGEWVEFWATISGPRLEVFHSMLHFSSIAEAWRYVSAHFENCRVAEEKDECHTTIPLYKNLGFDFFRPESLRFSAAPYVYNPLVSAKKVGSAWEVVLKGANEPGRAMVLLDESFKLLNIRKFSASQ